MKKIYLTRHAKARKEGDEDSFKDDFESDVKGEVESDVERDFKRPLSKKGKEELEKLIPSLKKHALKPDIIIASPALRTAQTAQILAQALDYEPSKIVFEDFLYEADALEIFKFLKKLDDNLSEVLLIGHNPALKELCELLCQVRLGAYPTSSTLAAGFEVAHFKDISERAGKILFFEKVKK